MKLEGSIDAFSLPDIFQLLSFTKKSGGLRLHHGVSDGVVHFSEGFVTGATADGVRQSLARRLIGAGVVDDGALEAAVAAVDEHRGVGQILIESGSVDAEVVRQAASEQTLDGVFDLLRWPAGDFAFSVEAVNPDDVGVRLTTEAVVAEATQRQAAWDAIAHVIPGPDAVLTMPVVLGVEPTLGREEWALLALVDGRRRVGDLVELTGVGQFAVVSTLAALVDRGLLQVRGDHDHVATVVRRQALLAPLEIRETAAPVDEAESDADVPTTDVADGAVADEPTEDQDTTEDTADSGEQDSPEQDADPESSESSPEASDESGEPSDETASEQTDSHSDEAEDVVDGHEDAIDEDSNDAEGHDHERAATETDSDESGQDTAEKEPVETDAADSASPDESEGAGAEAVVGGDQESSSEPEQRPSHVPAARLGQAHVPGDVVPARSEPFLPTRRPDHPEPAPTHLTGLPSAMPSAPAASAGPSAAPGQPGPGGTVGNTAVATSPEAAALIERDPSVNRSLLLRLIAGVRGL